jgi:hypothetical protein
MATVAATDLNQYSTTGPPLPALWPLRKGLAFGLDKAYDTFGAQSVDRWLLGLTTNGEAGVSDLPEVVNFSAGIYEDTTDSNPAWSNLDADVSQFGITETVSAGNCGVNPSIYAGCDGSPGSSAHRVSTPGTDFNTITVGAWTGSDPYDSSTWTPWPNSSPGPTFGGRKKPDLIATPVPPAGGPSNSSDTGYNTAAAGTGTSFAAPQAAAGAILLASAGVYAPTSQKAILINSAIPIQSQTYWTPTAGWGALNLDGAFAQRGNYQSGNTTPAGANSSRFYKQTGVMSGDRTTLVWNRRTIGNFNGLGSPAYQTLTNLDLVQIDAASGTNTASGGADSADTVDTNQTPSATNPIPGNGSDGQDNVEQTRSTANGTEIYKVKAQSTIDGATSEPFSIAGAHPVTALQTPIPNVALSASPAITGPGAPSTITATVTNPSADLALTGASVTLTLPPGVMLTTGTTTQSIGPLAANGTDVKTWTVAGSMEGVQALSAGASGTTYSEPFQGSDTETLTIDGTPPVVSISAAAPYSDVASVPFNWSATDDQTGIDHYDVELARDGGAFTPLLTNTTATSTSVDGSEGEALHLRVRAIDGGGNASGWATHDVTVDAIPLTISVGTPTIASGTISIPVSIFNVGSPTSASYSFSPGAKDRTVPLTGTVVSYTNTTSITQSPILVIGAADGLGRAASYFVKYTVVSSLADPKVRIATVKKQGQRVAVSGSINKAATGKVTVIATRMGKAGTKRAKKTVRISKGRFSARLKLSKGKYRVTATYSGGRTVGTGSSKKTISVK